ncbi:hypothetical protein BDZ89DRAFT_1140815 [Hymenopellis radicata]|nr:hypothetical protein BDZ89DRAFT_1140815 [Hymenopellis radicata]
MGSRSLHASWDDDDRRVLVDFLHGRKAEIGEGGNWTPTTLTAAESHMAATTTPAAGGPKTSGAIKTQWNSLKRTHEAIRQMKEKTYPGASGLTWSDDKGFDITPAMSTIWSNFLKAHKIFKPFRNAGWPLWTKIDEIVPDRAKGLHVFNAASSQTTDASSQDSQSTQNTNTSSQVTDSQSSQSDTPAEGTQSLSQSPSRSRSRSLSPTRDDFRDDVNQTSSAQPSQPIASPATSSSQSLGKRGSASDFETPSSKRGKLTGPEAIFSVSQSVYSISDALRDVFAPKGDASPQRKAAAQKLLQEADELELDDDEKVALHILFTQNVNAADAYRTAPAGTMRNAVARELLRKDRGF